MDELTDIDAITHNLSINHPNLLEGGVTVTDYYFIDCTKNEILPVSKFEAVKAYIIAAKITNFAMVISFSNNIIGYRLNV
jgi:hypothetical protein